MAIMAAVFAIATIEAVEERITHLLKFIQFNTCTIFTASSIPRCTHAMMLLDSNCIVSYQHSRVRAI
jgi:hypothetical protein